MRAKVLRRLALVSVVGVLAAGCADPARSVAPGVKPSKLTEEMVVTTDTADDPLLADLRVLLAAYKTDFDIEKTYWAAKSGDCAAGVQLSAAALEAYASSVSGRVPPPSDSKGWESLTENVVLSLGRLCPSAPVVLPSGLLGPNAIVRYVRASAGAQLRSPDELVALNIPAHAMDHDALVVVTRDPGTAPAPKLLGTDLQQYGPVYRIATYPAALLDMRVSQLELFVVGSSPTLVRAPAGVENSLAIVLAPGSGSSSEGTTVILRPTYCSLLFGRVGRFGGADFLKLTPKAPTSADLSLGGSSMAFFSDSAGTTGSGCGQAPPNLDGAALRAAGTASFDLQAPDMVVTTADANAVGTFGVVRIYDPARSAAVRAGLSARICGRVATLTNTTGQDVVAVIDPVNRATGRWSGWKLPVLVPPGGATARLPLTTGDDSAGEVQLSYGPESLAHVGLSSGCP